MPILDTLRSLLPRSASRPASPPRAAASWPLDTPLFRFPGWRDPWTLRHSFEGALILGRTGSGKDASVARQHQGDAAALMRRYSGGTEEKEGSI